MYYMHATFIPRAANGFPMIPVSEYIFDKVIPATAVGSANGSSINPSEKLDGQYEEAAYILGATPSKTFFKVILSEMKPAILTGFGLAFARGVGEKELTMMQSSGRTSIRNRNSTLTVIRI